MRLPCCMVAAWVGEGAEATPSPCPRRWPHPWPASVAALDALPPPWPASISTRPWPRLRLCKSPESSRICRNLPLPLTFLYCSTQTLSTTVPPFRGPLPSSIAPLWPTSARPAFAAPLLGHGRWPADPTFTTLARLHRHPASAVVCLSLPMAVGQPVDNHWQLFVAVRRAAQGYGARGCCLERRSVRSGLLLWERSAPRRSSVNAAALALVWANKRGKPFFFPTSPSPPPPPCRRPAAAIVPLLPHLLPLLLLPPLLPLSPWYALSLLPSFVFHLILVCGM